MHALFLFYLAAMALLFVLPVPPRYLQVAGRFDDVAHLGIFLGFTLLYRLDRRPSVVRAILVSASVAGGIEFVQSALPYRGGQWADFASGVVGALFGIALSVLIERWPTGSDSPASPSTSGGAEVG